MQMIALRAENARLRQAQHLFSSAIDQTKAESSTPGNDTAILVIAAQQRQFDVQRQWQEEQARQQRQQMAEQHLAMLAVQVSSLSAEQRSNFAVGSVDMVLQPMHVHACSAYVQRCGLRLLTSLATAGPAAATSLARQQVANMALQATVEHANDVAVQSAAASCLAALAGAADSPGAMAGVVETATAAMDQPKTALLVLQHIAAAMASDDSRMLLRNALVAEVCSTWLGKRQRRTTPIPRSCLAQSLA